MADNLAGEGRLAGSGNVVAFIHPRQREGRDVIVFASNGEQGAVDCLYKRG